MTRDLFGGTEIGDGIDCCEVIRCLDFEVENRAESTKSPVEADELQDLHDLAIRVVFLQAGHAAVGDARGGDNFVDERDETAISVWDVDAV
jgi:hypothetical protein